MRPLPYRKTALATIALAILTMTSACASTPAAEPVATSAPPSAAPTPSDPPAETTGLSATEGDLAWLEASRLPDVETACAGLSPDLVERMLDELESTGLGVVSDCEGMITFTAQAYRVLGQSADVDIDVQSETATDATLFVTYLDTGDCGTVVMTRPATEWILTDQSEECAA